MEIRKRDLVFGISTGISLGAVVGFILILFIGLGFEAYEERPETKKMREKAEETWTTRVESDLTKYFDVKVGSYSFPPIVVCERCRIIGVATRDVDEGNPFGRLVKGFLVLEMTDGRRFYIRNSEVTGLEESIVKVENDI